MEPDEAEDGNPKLTFSKLKDVPEEIRQLYSDSLSTQASGMADRYSSKLKEKFGYELVQESRETSYPVFRYVSHHRGDSGGEGLATQMQIFTQFSYIHQVTRGHFIFKKTEEYVHNSLLVSLWPFGYGSRWKELARKTVSQRSRRIILGNPIDRASMNIPESAELMLLDTDKFDEIIDVSEIFGNILGEYRESGADSKYIV